MGNEARTPPSPRTNLKKIPGKSSQSRLTFSKQNSARSPQLLLKNLQQTASEVTPVASYKLKTTWNFSGHPSRLLQTQNKIPARLAQSLSSHEVETKFKRGHHSRFELKIWTKFKRGHLSPALHKSKQNSREDTQAVFHKATKTKSKRPVGRQAESGRTARWAACWAADWASSWTAGWTASYTTYCIWLYGKLSLLWLWEAKNCMATFCQRSSWDWSNRGRSDKSEKKREPL